MATAKQTKKTDAASANENMRDEEAQAILDRKGDVRRAALMTRQELRPAARSNKSREICNKLIEELRASGIKGKNGQPPTLAVYAALRYEVDLDRFIRGAYAYGYRIVFPCMIPNAASGAMCMRSVSCNNYLGGNVPFIVDPVPNDLTRILDIAPIRTVCTTGGKANQLCRRFHGNLLKTRRIELVGLPSTSPANARMRLDDLVAAYRAVGALAPAATDLHGFGTAATHEPPRER